LSLVLPLSTRRCQSFLSTPCSSTSSQDRPISCKSCFTMSIEFLFQFSRPLLCSVRLPVRNLVRQSTIINLAQPNPINLKMCPNHLGLLFLIISSSSCSVVFSLTSSFWTSSFQEIPVSVAEAYDMLLLIVFFCI